MNKTGTYGNLLFDPLHTASKVTREVIVGFSTGKDSIILLDLCSKAFERVVPYFLYTVPGLEFQEECLIKYEQRYNTEIIRLPHPDFSAFLCSGTYRCRDYTVKPIDFSDLFAHLRNLTGIRYIATGERINESLFRRGRFSSEGSITLRNGRFYPIIYWNQAQVMSYIKKNRLYLPHSSQALGTSFGGLKADQLSFIKKTYPRDYERILTFFPHADAAVYKYENLE